MNKKLEKELKNFYYLVHKAKLEIVTAETKIPSIFVEVINGYLELVAEELLINPGNKNLQKVMAKAVYLLKVFNGLN